MGKDPRSLESNIIFLCGEFAHQFHHRLTAAFRENRIPITVEQFGILVVLYYRNGINQKEISAQLRRDKTTVARVVVNLEKNGLVERMTDKNDSRGKLIYLTDEGARLQTRAVACSGKLYHQATKGIPPAALEKALNVLATMGRNISK